MSIFIVAYQNRTVREQITFKDSSGANIALQTADKVRVKIGKSPATPLLDIVCNVNLAGGSYLTHANPAVLELAQGDLAAASIRPGTYEIEACIVDSTDTNRIKLAERGVFCLLSSQGGAIT